jgi:hypothetical protein
MGSIKIRAWLNLCRRAIISSAHQTTDRHHGLLGIPGCPFRLRGEANRPAGAHPHDRGRALATSSAPSRASSAPREGSLVNVEQREIVTIIQGEIPAAQTFDLSEIMRGATAGKATWNTSFEGWQSVPTNMLPPLVTETRRKRKGLTVASRSRSPGEPSRVHQQGAAVYGGWGGGGWPASFDQYHRSRVRIKISCLILTIPTGKDRNR